MDALDPGDAYREVFERIHLARNTLGEGVAPRALGDDRTRQGQADRPQLPGAAGAA